VATFAAIAHTHIPPCRCTLLQPLHHAHLLPHTVPIAPTSSPWHLPAFGWCLGDMLHCQDSLCLAATQLIPLALSPPPSPWDLRTNHPYSTAQHICATKLWPSVTGSFLPAWALYPRNCLPNIHRGTGGLRTPKQLPAYCKPHLTSLVDVASLKFIPPPAAVADLRSYLLPRRGRHLQLRRRRGWANHYDVATGRQ